MKRTRFTAHLSNGEKKVILSYDASSVRWHYERLGYSVEKVVKGDYRREARKAEQRPTGAQPNRLAIKDAIAFLGIKMPVSIKVTNHRGGRMGGHMALPTGGQVRVSGGRIQNLDSATGWKHEIRVKSWLTREQMGETIWHELAHAMQFERDAFRPDLDPRRVHTAWHVAYRDGTTYSHKPYEVEARSYEGYNAEIPLAR